MRISGVQLSVSMQTRHENLDRAEHYVRAAAREGANIICLQEYFAAGFFTATREPEYFSLAETAQGPTVSRFAKLAHALQVWLIVPFFEKDASVAARYFNAAAVVGPTGKVEGLYRKLYLALSETAFEQYYFSPGNLGCPVFKANDWPFGIAICHDRHFFEVPRAYLLQGAEIIFVPTSTRRAPGRFNLWEAELVSMAANNNVYVVGINSTGYNDGRDQFGRSMIIDPLGRPIARMEEEDGFVIADVSHDLVHEARISYFLVRDFRPDIARELLGLYGKGES